MSRRPETDESLVARGSKHLRDRRELRPNAPLTRPPRYLDAEARRAWKELVVGSPPGTLTVADGPAVEVAVALVCAFRRDPAGMPAARLAQLRGALASIGATPADRARVRPVPIEKKPDPTETGRTAASFFSTGTPRMFA